MREKTLFDVLEEVESTSGTNEKIRILTENKDVYLLADFLKFAIDDRIVFNVKKLPDYELIGGSCTLEQFGTLTGRLLSGESRGNAALKDIENTLEHATPLQNKWYRKCLQKDMASTKVGVSITNKVWPGLVLDFECMLAQPEDQILKANFEEGGYLDLKQNGVRTFFFLDENGKVFTPPFLRISNFNMRVPYARSGLPIPNFCFMNDRVEEIAAVTNMVIDCECHVGQCLPDAMSVYGFKYRSQDEFIGAKGKLKEKAWASYLEDEKRIDELKSRMKVAIIDVLTLEEWIAQESEREEHQRKDFINTLVLPEGVEKTPTEFVKNMEEAIAAAKKWINKKLEGGVYKPYRGLYEWKRSINWLKIKEEVECDVLVLSVYKAKQTFEPDGSPSPPMAGGVNVTDGKRFFQVGTGKGWTKEFYQELLANEENYKQKVMRITAQSFTDKAYINPRYDIWRPDKSAKDIIGEET
jgi:hypothetical protein